MYIAIRLRGKKAPKKIEDTMNILLLRKKYSMILVSNEKLPMLNKVKDFITYGKIDEEFVKKIKRKLGEKRVYYLHPPRKGLKSIKKHYPKGDLGKRDNIKELVERMWPI